MKLSIVSPVYRSEKIVPLLVQRIVDSVDSLNLDYEIILVDDGSPDNSWEMIEKECALNVKVVGVELSRNFGQHYAITAGLEMATGDWIVVMDCDLQDRPEEIPKMIEQIGDTTEILLARRTLRKDKFFKKASSKLYYSVLGYLTDTKQDPSVANFGLYKRNVIDSILEMGDYYRFLPTMVQWVGYSVEYIDVKHSEREEGKSSYNFMKLFSLGLSNTISFSDKPLRLTIKLGLIVILISIIFAGYILFKFATGIITELGYASLILSIWFLAGIIIFTLGVIGMYVSKSFDTVKQRPRYIVKSKLNGT